MTSEKVCEFYIVIDLSGSMSPYLQALDNALRSMINTFIDDPFTSDYCRVSLIGFGTNAKTLIPLCDLGKLETVPSFQTMGGTSYAAAFNEVFSRIQDDLRELRENKISFTRPNIFFLTDGSPTDNEYEWKEALERLRIPQWRPNLLVFGFGSALNNTISAIASREDYAFIASDSSNLNQLLSNLIPQLTQSIMQSGYSIANGTDAEFQCPPGFISLKLDELENVDI